MRDSGTVIAVIRSPKFRMLVGTLKPLFDTILINVAIQGRDCLVQKFRNSSVMLEHPGFRPKVTYSDDVLIKKIAKGLKIFHTGKGPLAGTEDTFPGPDNPSKMRRSVENAEHVGMFEQTMRFGPRLINLRL